MTALVAKDTSGFLVAIVTLVNKVTNVPVVTFATMFAKVKCSVVAMVTQRR